MYIVRFLCMQNKRSACIILVNCTTCVTNTMESRPNSEGRKMSRIPNAELKCDHLDRRKAKYQSVRIGDSSGIRSCMRAFTRSIRSSCNSFLVIGRTSIEVFGTHVKRRYSEHKICGFRWRHLVTDRRGSRRGSSSGLKLFASRGRRFILEINRKNCPSPRFVSKNLSFSFSLTISKISRVQRRTSLRFACLPYLSCSFLSHQKDRKRGREAELEEMCGFHGM